MCNSNLCQFRHSALKAFSFRNDSTETDDFASDVDGSENENSDWEYDYCLTDYETEDFQKPNEIDIGNCEYRECGACSKVYP